jgi:FixJ family two-component response regulator
MTSPTLIGVVDDDPAVCEAIKFCLEVDGFHVRAWTSGEKFRADPDLPHVGLVLLDWKMRPMDGLQVAETLMARPARPIIVMMTAARVDQLRDETARLGIVHLLQKPLAGKILSDLAAHLLR